MMIQLIILVLHLNIPGTEDVRDFTWTPHRHHFCRMGLRQSTRIDGNNQMRNNIASENKFALINCREVSGSSITLLLVITALVAATMTCSYCHYKVLKAKVDIH